MKKVAEMLRTVSRNNIRQCYALKCDIRKFFDSVDHDILLEILDTRIKDKNCKFSIEKLFPVILAFTRERERESTFPARKGVPIGNLTSQIFANVYMNVFDQFVKHDLKVKYYARYTDDFAIISDNKNYLKELLVPIKLFLQEN